MTEQEPTKLSTSTTSEIRLVKGINEGTKVSTLQNLGFGFGVFMTLFCGGLIVTYVSELIAGTGKHPIASQLGLIVFLSGICFVGIRMINSRGREQCAIKELQEEQLILNRAKANNGLLTVSQTALECRLRIADTKKAFERLAATSICQIDVTEDGELCYRFASFEKKPSN